MKEKHAIGLWFVLLFGMIFLIWGFYAWASEDGKVDPELGLMETITIVNHTKGTLIIRCADGHERSLHIKPGGTITDFRYNCEGYEYDN